MRRFVVWAMGLLAGTVWAAAAVAQPVTGVGVSGGSGLLVFDPNGIRTAVVLSTFTTAPTVLTFSKAPEAVDLPLSLALINGGAEPWSGLELSLSGGTFTAAPRVDLQVLAGTVWDVGSPLAQLPFETNPGTFAFVDLEIDLDQGTQAVLTVTPIVPEPTAGALWFTTLLLAGRRVRG